MTHLKTNNSNYMKRVKYILIVILTIHLLGCDDFLDKYPHASLSEGTFWQNESEIEMGLAACYSLLYSQYFSGGTGDAGNKVYWDGLTDNAFLGQYWEIVALTTGSVNPALGGVVSGYYSACFSLISRVNILLSNIEDAILDQDVKEKYIAEARFLRAYAYHELILNYGGVPLFEGAASIDDATKGRSDKNEIFDFIKKDLIYAIENLPNENYSGHVVKNSARGLLSRVLLYNGDWSEAAEYAQAVMSSGTSSLYSDYQSMFLTEGQGDENTEILFSVKFLAPNLYHSMDLKLGRHFNFNVLDDLVNDYLTINGLPIKEDQTYNPDSLWKNRDPRLQQSVFCREGEPWIYDEINGYRYYPEGTATKFLTKKYVNPNIDAGYDTRSDQDVILLRYADVLLMYAEAKNELGQFGETEWNETIRLIRERAGFTANLALNFPGGIKDELREIIRHERRIELALEGLRYYDLLRWGNIKEVWENIEGENPQKKVYDESKSLWPIPQSQIDYYEANGVVFEQNPGY